MNAATPSIPSYLRTLPRWILWQYRLREGEREPTKVPVDANGAAIDATRPAHWLTYQEAARLFSASVLNGGPVAFDRLGIVLGDTGQGWHLCGADLDRCMAQDGTVAGWAQPFIDMLLPTYIERSPSGEGLKALFAAEAATIAALREQRRLGEKGNSRTAKLPDDGSGRKRPGVELYADLRWFAVTGDHWPASAPEIVTLGTEAIGAVLEAMDVLASHKAGAAGAVPSGAPWTGAHLDDAQRGGFEAKLAAALQPGSLLARRWAGDTAGLADATRSGLAMAIGAATKALGFSSEEMCEALRRCEPTASWVAEKGEPGDCRELRRVWDNAAARGPALAFGDVAGIETPSALEGGKPAIQVVAGKLDEVATHAETALRGSGLPVFLRGDRPVRPVAREVPAPKGRTTISAGVAELGVAGLLDHLAQAAHWLRYDGRRKAVVPIDPPSVVAQVLLSRGGRLTLPPLAGVVTTPTLRPDGSLLIEPGYDPATRLYHVPDPKLELGGIVETPTWSDAWDALAELSELLTEFPFVAEVDRAVALSGLITPIVRGALTVRQCTPFVRRTLQVASPSWSTWSRRLRQASCARLRLPGGRRKRRKSGSSRCCCPASRS